MYLESIYIKLTFETTTNLFRRFLHFDHLILLEIRYSWVRLYKAELLRLGRGRDSKTGQKTMKKLYQPTNRRRDSGV